jgi:hypothetical protein
MKFDRHNPQNYTDLKILRHKGNEKLHDFMGGRIVMTPCLQYFLVSSPNYGLSLGKTYIDIMCGDSPDAQIMEKCFDAKSWAVDILPTENKLHKNFILGDVVELSTWEKLPKADIITCNAAIDLIPTEERDLLYNFIYYKLNKCGTFVFNHVPLVGGYGFNDFNEYQKLRKIGFDTWGGFKNVGAFFKH